MKNMLISAARMRAAHSFLLHWAFRQHNCCWCVQLLRSVKEQYLRKMINVLELRVGNRILFKQNNRIAGTECTLEHFELMRKGREADFFPVVLKAEILEKCGFEENKKYALYPQSREFALLLPLPGPQKQEVYAYIKNNGECFGRMMIAGAACSQNFYHLHQLQNLYFFVTGQELTVRL
jgi:hypothetical protein